MKEVKVFLVSSSHYRSSSASSSLNEDAKRLKMIIDTLNFIFGKTQQEADVSKFASIVNDLNRAKDVTKFLTKLSMGITRLSNECSNLRGVLSYIEKTCKDFTSDEWRQKGPEIKSQLNNLIEYKKSPILSECQVTIDCWWNNTELKSQGVRIKALQRIAHNYDIGIFLLGKDIKSKTKAKDEISFPNSYVLIELGVFNGLNKKMFIMKDDGNESSVKDGLNAVSIQSPFDCIDGFVKTIIDYVKERMIINRTSDDYIQARLYYNSNLSNRFVSYHGETERQQFLRLETKALYIGTKSAYCWEKIENNDRYIGNYIAKFLDNNRNTFGALKVDNVISFGPGVGNIDSKLMNYLPVDCCYVPVDLNASLAIKSREKMKSQGRNVPLSIIDDFEDSGCFHRLKTLIDKIIVDDIGPKNLFSMLGVTFSNLSMNCAEFFNGMSTLMDYDDYLLLDVMIYDSTKESDDDALITRTVSRISDDLNWNLIRNAINKKRLSNSQTLSIRKLLKDGKLICSRSKDEKQYTSVPRTKVLEITFDDRRKGSNILTIAKYYSFNNFEKFVQDHNFEITLCKEDIDNKRGVFLIKKKKAVLQ